MGWGGIANLPPGFDASGGKDRPSSLIDEVIRGRVPGLLASEEELFRDLRRHLLHRDYARYFELTMACAEVLFSRDGGKYRAAVLRDIVEPALRTAREQMDSVRNDMERYASAHRKAEYDPYSSLEQLIRKSRPIATAYPEASGAADLESHYVSVTAAVRAMAPVAGS